MGDERRTSEYNGRRELDKSKEFCPAHDFCVDRITANSEEISWMRKLMMGTLVTGLFTLVGVIVTLTVMLLKINAAG